MTAAIKTTWTAWETRTTNQITREQYQMSKLQVVANELFDLKLGVFESCETFASELSIVEPTKYYTKETFRRRFHDTRVPIFCCDFVWDATDFQTTFWKDGLDTDRLKYALREYYDAERARTFWTAHVAKQEFIDVTLPLTTLKWFTALRKENAAVFLRLVKDLRKRKADGSVTDNRQSASVIVGLIRHLQQQKQLVARKTWVKADLRLGWKNNIVEKDSFGLVESLDDDDPLLVTVKWIGCPTPIPTRVYHVSIATETDVQQALKALSLKSQADTVVIAKKDFWTYDFTDRTEARFISYIEKKGSREALTNVLMLDTDVVIGIHHLQEPKSEEERPEWNEAIDRKKKEILQEIKQVVAIRALAGKIFGTKVDGDLKKQVQDASAEANVDLDPNDTVHNWAAKVLGNDELSVRLLNLAAAQVEATRKENRSWLAKLEEPKEDVTPEEFHVWYTGLSSCGKAGGTCPECSATKQTVDNFITFKEHTAVLDFMGARKALVAAAADDSVAKKAASNAHNNWEALEMAFAMLSAEQRKRCLAALEFSIYIGTEANRVQLKKVAKSWTTDNKPKNYEIEALTTWYASLEDDSLEAEISDSARRVDSKQWMKVKKGWAGLLTQSGVRFEAARRGEYANLYNTRDTLGCARFWKSEKDSNFCYPAGSPYYEIAAKDLLKLVKDNWLEDQEERKVYQISRVSNIEQGVAKVDMKDAAGTKVTLTVDKLSKFKGISSASGEKRARAERSQAARKIAEDKKAQDEKEEAARAKVEAPKLAEPAAELAEVNAKVELAAATKLGAVKLAQAVTKGKQADAEKAKWEAQLANTASSSTSSQPVLRDAAAIPPVHTPSPMIISVPVNTGGSTDSAYYHDETDDLQDFMMLMDEEDSSFGKSSASTKTRTVIVICAMLGSFLLLLLLIILCSSRRRRTRRRVVHQRRPRRAGGPRVVRLSRSASSRQLPKDYYNWA